MRSYFAGLLSPAQRATLLTERHGTVYREVVRTMGRDGWLGVGWPTAYGGRGFGQIEQQIFVNEAARADIPLPAVTLQTVGPVLQEQGTRWQRDFFLPRILAGEIHFAIGYTEPEAGTDLAALRTSAVLDGDEYVVNGQKIFTTGAHDADYIWLACRTDPEAPRHRGITILIASTDDPGFSWTPIITHDGAHHVNATYYDHVRVPVRMRVGAENGGWRLITSQLNHERVMLGPAGRIAAMADRVREWAADRSLLARRGRAAGARPGRCRHARQRAAQLAGGGRTRAEHRRRVRDQGVLVRAGAADRAVAGRAGRPARRPGRPRHRGADDLAGRAAQAEHRAHVRRRRERGPARAHRHRRPGAAEGAAVTAPETITSAAERLAAAGDSKPRLARDPVNRPMIRNWLEAIGDPADPSAQECADTAPPAMIQVWTMPGLHGTRGGDDPLGVMSALLEQAGYTSIVATNCDQTYHRPVRVGEQLSVQSRLLDVTGPKRTALGEGWFVTTRSTWSSAGEPVATMDFRVLRFRPEPRKPPQGVATPSAPPGVSNNQVIRPVVSPDTEFFWAGTAVGELRLQRCGECGTLRHPPGPRCPSCGSMTPGYIVAAGVGEVYSYVVHHHPPVPGKKLPIVIALVQLPEGVRIVGRAPRRRSRIRCGSGCRCGPSSSGSTTT